MKKLLTAFFLGLFVFAGAPVVLHADEAATGAASEPAVDGAAKEAPKKTKHMKKKKKKHKKAKKAKKAAAPAAASDASAAPAEGAAK